jgi:hypothetical protein
MNKNSVNKNSVNKNSVNQNNSFYSLQNIENYKQDFNYSTIEIILKYNLLINEYLNFIYENIKLKNKSCNNFIIIRGLETISHVFSIILYYSKNIDLAFYHSQKAFYFYVEFIGQITDEQHSFLQLNSRDASLFVYKKTIFDINNDYKKNTKLEYSDFNVSQFEILHLQSCIIKEFIYLFIYNKTKHHIDSREITKEELNTCIKKMNKLIGFINNNNSDVIKYNDVLQFIENVKQEQDNNNNNKLESYYYNKIIQYINKGS